MSSNTLPVSGPARKPQFATTHWSVVLAAGKTSSRQQKQALEVLCQSYWFPLYVYPTQVEVTDLETQPEPEAEKSLESTREELE